MDGKQILLRRYRTMRRVKPMPPADAAALQAAEAGRRRQTIRPVE